MEKAAEPRESKAADDPKGTLSLFSSTGRNGKQLLSPVGDRSVNEITYIPSLSLTRQDFFSYFLFYIIYI